MPARKRIAAPNLITQVWTLEQPGYRVYHASHISLCHPNKHRQSENPRRFILGDGALPWNKPAFAVKREEMDGGIMYVGANPLRPQVRKGTIAVEMLAKSHHIEMPGMLAVFAQAEWLHIRD